MVKRPVIKDLFFWLLFTASLLIIAARILFISPVVVSGSSMEPTLNSGDRGFILKSTKEIAVGDIIVFHYDDRELIKRVIALPGDTVQISGSRVLVNNEPLVEDYLITYPEATTFVPNEGATLTVPENELFVLGDNRLNSNDSRRIGTIPLEDVLGKVAFLYSFTFY